MEKEGGVLTEAGGEAENSEYTQLYGEQPGKTWVESSWLILCMTNNWLGWLNNKPQPPYYFWLRSVGSVRHEAPSQFHYHWSRITQIVRLSNKQIWRKLNILPTKTSDNSPFSYSYFILSPWLCRWRIKRRFVVAILALFGFVNVYMLRLANISPKRIYRKQIAFLESIWVLPWWRWLQTRPVFFAMEPKRMWVRVLTLSILNGWKDQSLDETIWNL